MKASSFVIITGLSGSGKGTFLRSLEDRGYFCVDNLPLSLLGKFYELTQNTEGGALKAAVVMDVREGGNLRDFPLIFADLKKQPGVETTLWFLEASDDALVRRFSETRRPHPVDATRPILQSIAHEREIMAPIRAVADHILDTSHFNIHDLRERALSILDSRDSAHLLLSLVSFGYKYGVPIDADLVFDVRFLPNPHFVPHLKPQTGADPEVVEFMEAHPEAEEFLGHLRTFVDFLVPQYEKEGKSYVTIAIGCTGGRHRSVYIANALARHLEAQRYKVKVTHRDSEKA